MTFNYDPTTLRGRVRFYLGDRKDGNGPRPERENFTDLEIDQMLVDSQNNLTGAVVAGLMALANEWSDFAVSEWVALAQQKFDAKQVAVNYERRAKFYLENPIEGLPSGSKYGSIQLVRRDAWTLANATGSEYG